MKFQRSTAIALRDELNDKLASSVLTSSADEIELSPAVSALVADTVARNELVKAIDEAE